MSKQQRQFVIDDPIDYLKLRGRLVRTVLLSSLVVGMVSLPLWQRQEQIDVGQQRATAYTGNSQQHPEIILSVTVFLTSGSSLNRDASLPGWNPTSNTVDVIGGGGGSVNHTGSGAIGCGGGGGGGYARYTNMGALPATVTYAIGAGGAQAAGGTTSFNAGACSATGGAAGYQGAAGAGGGGTAGSYGYAGGAGGGVGVAGAAAGGGGGGAAGPYGNGVAGAANNTSNGGAGGAGGAGAGGGGGVGSVPLSYPAGAGGGGNEYGSGVGSGGGGGGGGAFGGYEYANHGGSYGGGGGGAAYGGTGSNGYQGVIIVTYTPLAVPTVSSCSPAQGTTLGGTAVTITGTGFQLISGVTFGGTAATSVVTVNTTTITCVTPAHLPGFVNVIVSNSSGGGTGTNVYNYIAGGGFNMPMMGI